MIKQIHIKIHHLTDKEQLGLLDVIRNYAFDKLPHDIVLNIELEDDVNNMITLLNKLTYKDREKVFKSFVKEGLE